MQRDKEGQDMNTLEGQQEWCKRPEKVQTNDGSGPAM